MATTEMKPDYANEEYGSSNEKVIDDAKPIHVLRHPIESTALYKKAKWKVDIFVTGVGIITYLLAFLDKANLGNARVAGLATDLKLTSWQYSVLVTCLYPTYILFDLPASIFLKKLGAHWVLPGCVTAFGLVSCLQGRVSSFEGLLACRVMLGAAEGAFIPALVIWQQSWYKRNEYQFRMACIFSFISLAGAFAGLLAAGILNLDGVHGVAGWQWIFYLEGGVTIGVGLLAFLVVRSGPDTAWWLKTDEKEAINIALEASGKHTENLGAFTWTEVLSAFKSPFVIGMFIVYLCNGCVLFGFAYFLPSVVSTFGYSPIRTQLFTVPVYAVAFVCTMTASFLGDRFRFRGPQFLLFGTLSAMGYIMALAAKADQKGLRYAALFFQFLAGGGVSPALGAWTVDNVAPYHKRATTIGVSFIATQVGGIISTWIYPLSQAPLYHPGASVSLVCALLVAIVPACEMIWLRRQNKRKAAFLAQVGPDHVFPPGPVKDTDPRWTYVI